MDTSFIKGIIPPILTPITANEEIDEEALRRLVEFIIEGGCSGILAFGSNGEFYMLSDEEMENALAIMIDQVAGRIPLFMGVGAIRTSTCIRHAQMGVRHARGVSILQPMFLRPTEDELKEHIRQSPLRYRIRRCCCTTIPAVRIWMSQQLVEELAHSIPNLVGMKDSSGDMTQTMEFIRRNRDVGFKVLSGKDTLIFAGLAHGAVGAVCSTANYLPKLVCSIYDKFVAGDFTGSLEAQYELNPIRLATDASSFLSRRRIWRILWVLMGKPFAEQEFPSRSDEEPPRPNGGGRLRGG